jgi:hypothetical protein
MGGVIAVGVRRSPGELETVEVWTNQLARNIHNGKFLTGNVSGFEFFLTEYKTAGGGLYGPSNHTPSQYGYVLVDYVDKRIVTVSSYDAMSVKFGVSFKVEAEIGHREDREGVQSLMSHIHARWDGGELKDVGPFTTVGELIENPDFEEKHAYAIHSSYWKSEDCNCNQAGYTHMRDIPKGMVSFNYAEEIAWAKVTGDRQPVIDY